MKQRDLELLSSYLDGQLSLSDSARLEARLRTEPDLRSVLRDLRNARSLLRQLPMRKAPRSFTLTPKMVGTNPPLPRAYPAFRFTSALATILLFITFGLNFLRPQLASAPQFGMGGGGAPDTFAAESAPAEAPAATEAPAAEAPPEEPSILMVPMPTASAMAEDTARAAETAIAKTQDSANATGAGPVEQAPQPTATAPLVSPAWQWLLAGVALLSAFVMALMRQLSTSRWRRKN